MLDVFSTVVLAPSPFFPAKPGRECRAQGPALECARRGPALECRYRGASIEWQKVPLTAALFILGPRIHEDDGNGMFNNVTRHSREGGTAMTMVKGRNDRSLSPCA